MDYSKVSLHFLRIYARDIGVKSPSSYKKDLLIKKIKEVESGEVEPFFSKKGRPANKEVVHKTGQPKVESYTKEKRVLLFAIDRFIEFLDELKKEIENKF